MSALSSHMQRGLSPDGGPPFIPPLRGTICKLADRPCPLAILRDPSFKLPWLAISSIAPSLAPMDIMDTERLCAPSFVVLLGPAAHDPDPACVRPMLTGAVKEIVFRWPLIGGAGLGLEVTLLLTFVEGTFLCLSPPCANPLAADGCRDVLDGAGVVATFLKVI